MATLEFQKYKFKKEYDPKGVMPKLLKSEWRQVGYSEAEIATIMYPLPVEYQMSVNLYFQLARRPEYNSLRKGQLAMHCLSVTNYQLYKRIQGTDIDIFEIDSIPDKYIDYVKEHWDDVPLSEVAGTEVWPETKGWIIVDRHLKELTGEEIVYVKGTTKVYFERKHASIDLIKLVMADEGIKEIKL